MRNAWALAMGGVWLGLAGAALGSILVDGDAGAGQQKAAVCAACHGPDGNSTNPQWPKIAGQNAAYLLKQLHNFKNPDTGRNNPIMTAQVAALSDQDMADLAEYFAAQPPSPGVADPQLVETGQALYRGGDLERGIVACSGCHGPQGRGNAAAKIPALAGQHAEYTAAQLKAFRAMERANDPNQMMRDAAMRLTDQDIAAVASYLQGLR